MITKFNMTDRSFAKNSQIDYGKVYDLDLDESSVALLDSSLNHSQAQQAYQREQLKNQTFYKLLQTVMAYLESDIKKKYTNFIIGVCSIFLVVSFITSLKSIIDVAPIAFLKVGQDQAGAIDLSLKAD